ncbi:MAG TPA: hypothetical protein VGX03_39410 [Candidatus Binatia bacterium]|jgi:hypothetical protein|nr:hypothetical protein [Candidatus Binatia bacterium]
MSTPQNEASHRGSERQQPLTLRDEQKLLTRRRLIAAARTVFVTYGHGAAPVEETVAAAERRVDRLLHEEARRYSEFHLGETRNRV